LPKGRLSTRYLSASAASGNGKDLATFPGFVPKRLRLSKDREALDAGPLPDQIGDIDGGLTLGCITKCRQTSTNRKRREGLVQGSAPDAADHKDDVHCPHDANPDGPGSHQHSFGAIRPSPSFLV
jgi:hypothetical protein